MSIVDNVSVFTATLNNEVFIVPEGARTIDLNNVGGAGGTFTGNASRGGKSPSAVTLASGVAYSFGNVGKPYPAITIDATGTQIEITANY